MSDSLFEQQAQELEALRKRVRELEQAEMQSRRIQEAMERQDAILRVIAYAGEEIVLRHPYKVLPDLMTRLGEAAAVSRVYVFENGTDEQGNWITSRRFEWVSSSDLAQINNPELQNFPLQTAGFSHWIDVLSSGRVLYGTASDFPEVERKFLEAQAVKSIVVVPIFSDNHWWGFLGFDECEWERQWLTVEVEALRSVASTLGAAFTRQKIAEAERQQRAIAEALKDVTTALTSSLEPDVVLSRILENVWRVLPHDAANVMLIDGNEASLMYMHGYPEEDEETIRSNHYTFDLPGLKDMLYTAQPYLVEDTRKDPKWGTANPGFDWVKSYMGIPIRRQGQVIGFLNLDSATPGYFSAAQIEPLQSFADHAAIALENAQIYEKISETALEYNALHRATTFLFTSLSTAKNLQQLSEQIVTAIIKSFGLLDCGVMMLDEESGELIRLARAGEYRVQPTARIFRDGIGLVPEAVRTGEFIYVPDVSKDSRYAANVAETQSELVIPLKTSKGVVGVLDLQSLRLNGFAERDIKVLVSFAERVAMAMENVQLYAQISQYAEELEERVRERTAQLKRTTEQSEAILNSSNNAIALTSPDGIIKQVNPAFGELFGEKNPIEQSLLTVVDEDSVDTVVRVLKETVSTRTPTVIEILTKRENGSGFNADLALSAVTDDAGEVVGIVCNFHDITEHKRVAESLQLALQRERELGELRSQFITTTSHEFRTPLATILSASDLLRSYRDRMTPEQIDAKLNNIHNQVRHMTELLEDVHTIGRVESGSVQFVAATIDIAAFCQQAVNDFNTMSTTTHQVVFHHDGDCGDITGDAKLLREVITNLLSNAVKFSPQNRVVWFNLDCRSDAVVALRFRDEGIGIPERERRAIFEPFRRASNIGNAPGTGLGLVIARHAVELHHGKIEVESVEGEGTTFIVTLPREYRATGRLSGDQSIFST